MLPEGAKVIDLCCANCGCQLASGIWRTNNTIISYLKIYCSDCFYSSIQQNRQYRTRNKFLEKKMKNMTEMRKDLTKLDKALAKRKDNTNFECDTLR